MRLEPAVPIQALGAIRAPLLASGATPVDAPILQPLGLLLDLAGEAMRARLFVVQSEGGTEACLRPDFTVAVARSHLDEGSAAGRCFYEGPAFRAAPDSDQAEEFQQLGVELFEPADSPAVETDALAMSLAWRAAEAGGRDDLTLWLGDVALLSAFIETLSLGDALASRVKRVAGRPRLLQAELARAGETLAEAGGGQLAAMLAGLTEAQAATMLEEVWSLAGVAPVGGRGAAEIAQRLVRRAETASAPSLTTGQAEAIRDFMAISAAPDEALDQVRALAGAKAGVLAQALDGWRLRLDRLASAVPEDRMRFAPALGHDFDYYDGVTFEVRSATLGDDRPVAVGGRYDGLMARLGGQASRAVGCMVRPWRAYSGGEA